jgi:putative ABC transport system ATP-binding protein
VELFEQGHDFGVAIVVITHDQAIAGRMPRRIEVLDGHIVADTTRSAATATVPSGRSDEPSRRQEP